MKLTQKEFKELVNEEVKRQLRERQGDSFDIKTIEAAEEELISLGGKKRASGLIYNGKRVEKMFGSKITKTTVSGMRDWLEISYSIKDFTIDVWEDGPVVATKNKKSHYFKHFDSVVFLDTQLAYFKKLGFDEAVNKIKSAFIVEDKTLRKLNNIDELTAALKDANKLKDFEKEYEKFINLFINKIN